MELYVLTYETTYGSLGVVGVYSTYDRAVEAEGLHSEQYAHLDSTYSLDLVDLDGGNE